MNQLNDEEKEKGIKPEDQRYQQVKIDVINPKAITIDELYGNMDDSTPPQW